MQWMNLPRTRTQIVDQRQVRVRVYVCVCTKPISSCGKYFFEMLVKIFHHRGIRSIRASLCAHTHTLTHAWCMYINRYAHGRYAMSCAATATQLSCDYCHSTAHVVAVAIAVTAAGRISSHTVTKICTIFSRNIWKWIENSFVGLSNYVETFRRKTLTSRQGGGAHYTNMLVG